ncbi:DUF4338 domain-containing protein [Pseudomonas lundensis]|uniref:DUF4338 domain-containing protein n=1 Tax=Pseudomonas lundensis TaxID=86185 RepID=UPI00211C1927|nr:DUF4338 domain-containing protein [Pseudomonas lundensis]
MAVRQIIQASKALEFPGDLDSGPSKGNELYSGEISQDMLRADIHNAWSTCRDAISTGDKDTIRSFHLAAKDWDKSVDYFQLSRQLEKYKAYFPHGSLIDPSKVDIELLPVKERSLEERLFKITRGYWSMPYSKGYGRRLRFVIIDKYHKSVVGIIGLQSPSADLSCRDMYLGVAKDKKLEVINNTLDAYTIGATPVYAALLGGKLVAGLLHSEVIRKQYWALYGNKRTTQLNRRVPQPLLAITTASAFGRSSIYNRLKDDSCLLAKPLGYTKGFGTIHLEELYPRIVQWLKYTERHVPAGFGNGPKVRWQNIMRALVDLGISREYLSHGLKREVFIFELVRNIHSVCQDGAVPDVTSFNDVVWLNFWKNRWAIPRSERDERWKSIDAYQIIKDSLERNHS